MSGGPTGPTPAALTEYLYTLVDGFDQLIAAALDTPGFSGDALTDIQDYRDAIAEAAASEAGPGPGPDDVLLGARVEEFLTSYCPDVSTDDEVQPPTHLGSETHDDDNDDTDGPSGNCGSMQFALLVLVADELGLDHTAVSQPYIDAMNAIVDGIDPGPTFGVGDLSPMIANEQVGCQGAQAMQQFFIDQGLGSIIEDTELGA